MEIKPLVIEQEFEAPAELVWRLITDKELMKKWYFDIPDFKLELGAKFHFEASTEKACYVHLCEILEIVPFKKLKYSWKYEGYAGLSFVTFELEPMGNRTKLKLTHEGLDTLPQENLHFRNDNFIQGWKFLIQESLIKYQEKEKAYGNTIQKRKG